MESRLCPDDETGSKYLNESATSSLKNALCCMIDDMQRHSKPENNLLEKSALSNSY